MDGKKGKKVFVVGDIISNVFKFCLKDVEMTVYVYESMVFVKILLTNKDFIWFEGGLVL